MQLIILVVIKIYYTFFPNRFFFSGQLIFYHFI